MRPAKLIEVDMVRAAAILLILAAHMPAYAKLGGLADCEIYLVTLGLSLFVFISGYCLARKDRQMRSLRDVKDFVGQRFLRLYPLYVPALLLFILLFQCLGVFHKIDFSPIGWKTAIHLCAAQELAAPRLAPLFTLWYVGAICMYYAVYVILARCGGGVLRTIAVAALVFALCLVVRHSLGLIGNRFFMYYTPFVAGIVAAKAHWMEASRRNAVVVSILFATFVVSGACLWDLKGVVYDTNGENWLKSTYGEILRLAFSLSGVLVAVDLARLMVRSLSNAVQKMMVAISFASYAIYLYHRPFLAIMYSFNKHAIGISSTLNGVLLIVFGLPLLIVACYYVQRWETLGVNYVRTRRWPIQRGAGEECAG